MADSFTIRRLTPKDAAAFRSIRLEALRSAPRFFGYSFAEEAVEPLSFFSNRLETHVVFGVWREDTLKGIAAMERGGLAKTRHKGTIWGIYLMPDARGHGLAKNMLATLINDVRGMVSELRLTVSTDNPAAYRLYHDLGFREYGREPRALKIGDVFHDEFLMALSLE
ncbi:MULTISPECIES: GNAT family N-acetyltransferase [unclassified Neorhizobium]|uniref:GNAT family N-acetyltransferase n=1 Tax=unclassified Neorhizobium TaxID=2629175 RepID=UPI001FF2CD61|nr:MULTISPECIES: N-acetyltransferase [unclassified Neorhizobium]MCJ9669002.1 GNAT family N-acetyltransferase [Neorhizobium sp. SHOUNA12B]MCJ9744956.1 GNAT family N-acetyltransferase [Neorhizobium sp. SHOUNA12A]